MNGNLYIQRFSLFLAPSIYENEDIKKGILLQLFGGAKKDFGETGRGHFRQVYSLCKEDFKKLHNGGFVS